MLVENRLSRRDHHINMPDTDFYKETAQKDVKKWDDEAIKRAKTKLLAEMKDPDREIIGKAEHTWHFTAVISCCSNTFFVAASTSISAPHRCCL